MIERLKESWEAIKRWLDKQWRRFEGWLVSEPSYRYPYHPDESKVD